MAGCQRLNVGSVPQTFYGIPSVSTTGHPIGNARSSATVVPMSTQLRWTYQPTFLLPHSKALFIFATPSSSVYILLRACNYALGCLRTHRPVPTPSYGSYPVDCLSRVILCGQDGG